MTSMAKKLGILCLRKDQVSDDGKTNTIIAAERASILFLSIVASFLCQSYAHADSKVTESYACNKSMQLSSSSVARFVICTSLGLSSAWSVHRNGSTSSPLDNCSEARDYCLTAFAGQSSNLCTPNRLNELKPAVALCTASKGKTLMKSCVDQTAALMKKMFRQNISCSSADTIVNRSKEPKMPFYSPGCKAFLKACPDLYRETISSE